MRYGVPKEKRNLLLLYELGKIAFTFAEYGLSLTYFRDLERFSQGHPKRWGILDEGKDESGKRIEFFGSIVELQSSVGFVHIPKLDRRVRFLRYGQKSEFQLGENVTLAIGFNYRGWLAIDLSK
jgi:hypothetical protein